MRSHWIAGTIGFLAAASAWSTTAQAQVTGQLEVKLLVTASCDVSGSAAGKLGNAVLDFGSATLLQDAINGQTATSGAQAFQVLCNPGVAYTLSFNAGQNAALVANRAMKITTGPSWCSTSSIPTPAAALSWRRWGERVRVRRRSSTSTALYPRKPLQSRGTTRTSSP
jgi:spore coat protein U-like protein